MFENSKWIKFPFEKVDLANKYRPAPYIAKSFTVKGKVKKSVLHAYGYTQAAYFLNGKVIPDSYLPTVPCTLENIVVYNDFDVTDILHDGVNRLGLMLSLFRTRADEIEEPAVAILQLDIEYADGSKDVIVSDSSFKGTFAAIVFDYSECGAVYDANLEINEWCNEDFDDSDWQPVIEFSGEEFAKNGFRTSICPPIRRISERPGREIEPGLYEFGTTTSGYVRACISGKKGARVTLKYAERLLPGGKHIDPSTYLLDKKRCPSMYNTDEYILDGTKNKVFDNNYFSIHGFRYVEVIGDYDDISLTAVICYTDMKQVSSFKCNDEKINKIHDACANSISTCLQTYFVDNPKRDAPWVGDQMLSAQSTAMLFDSYNAHYENMLMCKESQQEDGSLACMLPATNKHWTFQYEQFIGPDWTHSVMFLVPYYVYKYTKKQEIVDIMWDPMEKSLEFFKTLNDDGSYLLNKMGTGDWSAVKSGCPLEIPMTIYYRICAIIMAELAEATNRDSSKYRTLAENIKNAYRNKYVSNGKINGKHISEFILPVYGGFLEKEEIDSAVATILSKIKEDNYAFTCGIHGIRMILDVLSENGYAQTIYDVLINDKVLGYARNINLGFDTVPENFVWENNGSVSLNHHFFSAPITWIYKWVAGIKVKGFGYDDVEISPEKINGIDCFEAEMHGISVSLKNNVYTVDCPYDFTFKYGSINKKYTKGNYKITV